MIDTTIRIRNRVRRQILAYGTPSPGTLRAYRSSPEDVTIQIRRDKDIISAALSFSEAAEFAQAIIAAVAGEEPAS